MSVDILTKEVAEFEDELFAPETGLFDPEGVHHEFTQELHGPKLDMGLILPGTPLYEKWVRLSAVFARNIYKESLRRAVLVGTADGMTGVTHDIVDELDNGVLALDTRKTSKNTVELTEGAIELLKSQNPQLAIQTEDVATRSTNSASGVASVHQHRTPGLRSIEVVNTVERGILEWLLQMKVPYHSMIRKRMKDFRVDECARTGYCAQGWKLVPHGQ